MGGPSIPKVAPLPPPSDPSDEAIRNARLAERRRQLGLQGRMSTFLTDFQGQRGSGASAQTATASLLGQ